MTEYPEGKKLVEPIVITLDDLAMEEPIKAVAYSESIKKYPGLNAIPVDSVSVTTNSGFAQFGGSQAKQNALFGLIGGVLAWIINGRLFGFGASQSMALPLLLKMGLFSGIISALISASLGAADGITSKVQEKAIKNGLTGFFIGFAGGFIGGVIAQLFYGAMHGGGRGYSMANQVFARTMAWALVGLFIGIAQGISGFQSRKIVNGLIGGLIGGAIGGICFDAIGNAFSGGSVSRLFGIMAMGTSTGWAIGLVEEARKEAWMRVAEGPQNGKQFIIYGTVTRVGSSPKCEIVLVKDIKVAPEHCRLIAEQGGYKIEVCGGAYTLINGQPVNCARLRKGDIITIGLSQLVFEDRVVAFTAR